MLTLRDYPGRGIPDAGNESSIRYRDCPGYPMFVCWRADDDQGNSVNVLVGFQTIVAARINGILLSERAALQEAANAAYKPGDNEVMLLAPVA